MDVPSPQDEAPPSPTRMSQAEVAELARRITRPIVLVGLMGVGKSSLGRRLSAVLGLPFHDADDAIVEAAKMPISEIFERYGEATFRDGERRVIARLMEGDSPAIIATGGGAFVNDQTRALILDRGTAIWLDADIPTLVERTAGRSHRPLLQQGNPSETLARLHKERAPFYAQAPIRVTSTPGPHARTLHQILKALSEWL